jgi:capsular polysaccharide biosynthesis protein
VELTAADYLAIIRRRFLVVVAMVLLFGGIAYAMQSATSPTYSATAEVFLNPIIDPVSGTPQVSKRDTLVNMDTEQRLAVSIDVAEEVRKDLSITDVSARELRNHVATAAVPETELLRITYRGSQPEIAIERARAWAEQYLSRRKSGVLADRAETVASLQTQIDDATADLAEISQEIDDLTPGSADRFSAEARREAKQRLLTSLQDSLVTVTSASANTGQITDAPSFAKTLRPFGKRETTAVLFAGVLIGIVAAFVVDRSDRRIRRVDDVVALGVASLGSFARAQPDGDAASRARSMLAGAADAPKALLVAPIDDPIAGAVVGDGLARAYAAAGQRVVVIAADADHPELERLLGVSPTPGLSDAISNGQLLDQLAIGVDTKVGVLAAVGSGASGGWQPGMLARRDAHALMRDAADRVDILIIVCAPLSSSPAGLDLADLVDSCVIAARSRVTSAVRFASGLAELRRVGINVAGAILVGRK